MQPNHGRHVRSAFTAIISATLTCSVSLSANPARAGAVPAQPAHNFVNSVGVGTFFGWDNSPYRIRYGQVKARLAELGIKHIRDNVTGQPAASLFRDLHSSLGVRLLALVDLRTGSGANQRLDASKVKAHLTSIKNMLGTAPLIGLEGPNEPNMLERLYGYKGWPNDARRFQTVLHSAVRADPAFAGKVLVQPSLGGPNSEFYYSRMGNYTGIADVGNLHIYPNWSPWEPIAHREYTSARPTMPGHAFWATESGWHSAIYSNAQFLSRFNMLRYWPRALAGFNTYASIKKGYIFDLVDREYDPGKTKVHYNYGLIDYTGNVKPAFYAVRNMMHVMCDNPLRSAAGSLRYSLSGNLANVRTHLYKKNNGAFYLLAWVEKPGIQGLSPSRSRDIINPPQAVTMKFEQGVSLVRRYEPGDPYGDVTRANNPMESFNNPRSLNLSVRDSLIVLEIVPAGVAKPAVSKSCNFRAT